MRRSSFRPTWINLPSGESVRHAVADGTDGAMLETPTNNFRRI